MKEKLTKLAILAVVFASGMVAQYNIKPIETKGNPIVNQVRANVQYLYPQVTPCDYRWNMLQRIYKVTGIWAVDCPDIQSDGVWYTVPTFDIELNETQLNALNTLMTGPTPCDPPPATGTKYKFVDIYENRGLLGQKFQLSNFWIWYGSGGAEVFIYFDNVLNAGEKTKVKTEFANLFQEF